MSEYKAYSVTDTTSYEYSAIVFARSRNEARKLAMYTDACEDAEYINIRAVRKHALDSYYKGRTEMDWEDPADRVAMVRDGGFECSEEIWDLDCENCPATQWCGRYEREHMNE